MCYPKCILCDLQISTTSYKRFSHEDTYSHLRDALRTYSPPPLNLTLDGHTIKQVRVYKFLGIQINDTLTWKDHIDFIISKASRQINLLRRLSWFLPTPLRILFYKSYIMPIFDYCDVVWQQCTSQESTV